MKEVVTNRLAADAVRFKIDLQAAADHQTESLRAQLKASADLEIERARAFLVRASRVHERQIDVLQALHFHLAEAQVLFQGQTSSGTFKGEMSEEEYGKVLMEVLGKAHKDLRQGRLLVPAALADDCDELFSAVFGGQVNFAEVRDPAMALSPDRRAEFLKRPGQAAHTRVPAILRRIEAAARAVIYGDPPEIARSPDHQATK